MNIVSNFYPLFFVLSLVYFSCSFAMDGDTKRRAQEPIMHDSACGPDLHDYMQELLKRDEQNIRQLSFQKIVDQAIKERKKNKRGSKEQLSRSTLMGTTPQAKSFSPIILKSGQLYHNTNQPHCAEDALLPESVYDYSRKTYLPGVIQNVNHKQTYKDYARARIDTRTSKVSYFIHADQPMHTLNI